MIKLLSKIIEPSNYLSINVLLKIKTRQHIVYCFLKFFDNLKAIGEKFCTSDLLGQNLIAFSLVTIPEKKKKS